MAKHRVVNIKTFVLLLVSNFISSILYESTEILHDRNAYFLARIITAESKTHSKSANQPSLV